MGVRADGWDAEQELAFEGVMEVGFAEGQQEGRAEVPALITQAERTRPPLSLLF